MYVLLLALGVITTSVGVFTVGFAIPIHEFSLGNTLIISGSTAVVGGMILVGLAAAVRQLRRIADALPARPAPRRQPIADPTEPQMAGHGRSGPGSRIPLPSRPGLEPAGREPRPLEPRASAAPSTDATGPEQAPAERPRPNIFGVARSANETTVVEEPDSVPLAPARMPPPVGRSAPAAEPAFEPKFSPADILARLASPATRPTANPETQRADVPGRPAEPSRRNMFDAVWPEEVKKNRLSRSEFVPRAPKSDTRPDVKSDTQPEPPIAPERAEPAANGEMRGEAREDVSSQRPSTEPKPTSILKSGVIDGMAYTLYTDGSIEAQLPQGTMRFTSIEELRAHLEKNS